MSYSTLSRLSGCALFAGGLVGTVSMAFHPPGHSLVDPRNVPVHLALYTGILLILLGLPGLCVRLAPRAGVSAPVGTTLLFFGLAFEDPLHSIVAFTVVPTIAADPAARPLLDGPPPALMMVLQMAALPFIFAGLIVLAIAILRTRALPRWLAVPLLATVVAVPVGFAIPPLGELGPALLYLALALVGHPLLTAPPAQEASPMATRVPAQPAYS